MHAMETVKSLKTKTRMQSYYIIFHAIHWFAVRCMLFSILERLFFAIRFNSVQLSWVKFTLVQFHSLSPSFAFISLFARKFAFHILFASIPINLLALSLSSSRTLPCISFSPSRIMFSLFCWCWFRLLSRFIGFPQKGHNRFKTIDNAIE